jgi:DNA-binding NarL/FixJ family response regulator
MRKKDGRIRLLLVDDHEVVRVALRVLLERTGDIRVVDEAGTASRAREQVMKHRPDVVLLDVRLPDRSGVDLCQDIRAALPRTRVLFLTAFPDDETLLSSVVGGADGYLHKTIGLESLVEAIKAVASGECYLDHAAVGSVMNWLRTSPLPADSAAIFQLSPQERRVIALVADGKTNKEIGAALKLSEKTVKNYVSNAFEKLQVTRRAQAAALFVKTLSDAPSLLR